MGKKQGRQPTLFWISKSILGVDIIQRKRGFWGFLGVFFPTICPSIFSLLFARRFSGFGGGPGAKKGGPGGGSGGGPRESRGGEGGLGGGQKGPKMAFLGQNSCGL